MSLLIEASQLYSASKYKEAEDRLHSVLSTEPGTIQAKAMLGVIYSKTKRHPLAVDTLRAVLESEPDQVDSLVWMAVSLKALGDVDEAIAMCERAIEICPRDPATHNTLGLCYLSARRAHEAINSFNLAIGLSPESAPLHHNLGLTLRLVEDSDGACEAFQAAIDLEPLNEGNYLQLYRQHFLIGAAESAIPCLEAGVRRIPNSIAIQDALAMSYCRANQLQRGEHVFKRILRLRPGYCHSYSLWLQEQGRFSESVALLKKWLQIEPVQGMAYFGLSEANLFDFEDGTSLIQRATALENHPKLRSVDRMYLAYALGRAFEYHVDYKASIEHFDRANELAYRVFHAERRLDFDVVRENYDRLISLFTRTTLEENRSSGCADESPIFIVGMPRSGTTLLDQILSSHPMVASAGESPYWKLNGGRLTRKWVQSGLDVTDIPSIAAGYLNCLSQVAGGAKRFTDKQPLNFEMLGLIATVFPDAKILHVRRNPLDTCLSIYTTHFGGGPNFAYNKENIVFVYREYLRLMEHWRRTIPADRLLEVDYERLVSDTAAATQEIVEFCDLSWDESCLNHSGNSAAVSTPSRWQARQPIYKTSVERWRKFEPWLGRLLELRDVSHPS